MKYLLKGTSQEEREEEREKQEKENYTRRTLPYALKIIDDWKSHKRVAEDDAKRTVRFVGKLIREGGRAALLSECIRYGLGGFNSRLAPPLRDENFSTLSGLYTNTAEMAKRLKLKSLEKRISDAEATIF